VSLGAQQRMQLLPGQLGIMSSLTGLLPSSTTSQGHKGRVGSSSQGWVQELQGQEQCWMSWG
jgi:hypothetical protein